jgi:hypothetical protein
MLEGCAEDERGGKRGGKKGAREGASEGTKEDKRGQERAREETREETREERGQERVEEEDLASGAQADCEGGGDRTTADTPEQESGECGTQRAEGKESRVFRGCAPLLSTTREDGREADAGTAPHVQRTHTLGTVQLGRRVIGK